MREEELTISVPTSSAHETSSELDPLLLNDENNSPELQVSYSANSTGMIIYSCCIYFYEFNFIFPLLLKRVLLLHPTSVYEWL